jgi:hypothetical protein
MPIIGPEMKTFFFMRLTLKSKTTKTNILFSKGCFLMVSREQV